MPKKPILEAIATLVGFIIGAGILGIPFVAARAGFWTGVVDIVLIGIALLVVNLYIGEVVLRTRESHQLTGYAKRYLGNYGKQLMTFCMVFGMYGALIAYTIKEGEFLNEIFGPSFGGNALVYSIIFFLAAGFLIYKGLNIIEKSELWMVILFILIVCVIFIFSLPSIKPENLTGFDIKNMFVPYGVVLFAFLGIGAIPELREELRNNRKDIKKAIVIGSLVPLVVYLLFAFMVVGVTGKATTDGAIIGLNNVLGYNIFLLAIVFGILTMATSFIAIGLALKEMYCFDFKVKDKLSSCLVCFVPLAVSLAIIFMRIDNAFFKVIEITGAIAGGLTGILVIEMFWMAKMKGERKPEYIISGNKLVGFLLMAVFFIGMIYEVIKVIRFLF